MERLVQLVLLVRLVIQDQQVLQAHLELRVQLGLLEQRVIPALLVP
jgi:hypothetical protein